MFISSTRLVRLNSPPGPRWQISRVQTMPTTMKIFRIANLAVLSFALSIALAVAAHTDDKAVPGWDPAVFRDASTIKIMTTEPDVGEHWSNLWVVVIDGQPFVRLGDRSYGRIQRKYRPPLCEIESG